MKKNVVCYISLIVSIGMTFFASMGLLHRCSSERHTIFKHDTIIIMDTVQICSPNLIEEKYIEVVAPVDTEAIIKDYFTQRIYQDTIRIKEYATVIVHDTVFRNENIGRDIFVEMNMSRIRQRKLSVGLYGSKKHFSAMLGYQKQNMTYEVGYDLVQHAPTLGIRYNIW